MDNPFVPLSSFVLKVTARCNLACTYCYEFFALDQSWRNRPKRMTLETALEVGRRIGEHAAHHNLHTVHILLHGGEPLLLGKHGLCELVESLKQGVGGRTKIAFGVQTNGTLIDSDWCEVFRSQDIMVGVSCDGPPVIADMARVDHAGRGSGASLEDGLRLMRGNPQFGGLLCVINPSTNPREIWRYLAKWHPPMVDFLLPHATWVSPPYDLGDAGLAPYGDWLIDLFDCWMSEGPHGVSIRYLEEIIRRALGSPGTLESLGEEPVTLLVVNVDGEYEGVDSLKASQVGAWVTGLNVRTNAIDEVFTNSLIALRQSGALQLAPECLECDIRKECGGGYLPHRYHAERGFSAPSVYCRDITRLTKHVITVMQQSADG